MEADKAAATLPKAPEFSRPYVFDISDIWVSDSRKVRLTFLFKTYVDWIALDTTADLPLTFDEVTLSTAELRAHGLDAKTSEEEVYEYVYGEPNEATGYFPGSYTRFGDVTPLLETTDDMFVVYGGGDELALRFDPPPAPAAGTERSYLVYTNGYYKDAKVDVAHTVDPMPFAAMSNFPYPDTESYPDDTAHRDYLANWNTREVVPAVGIDPQAEVTVLGGLIDTASEFVRGVWDGLVSFVTPDGGDAVETVEAGVPSDASLAQVVVAADDSELDAGDQGIHYSINTDQVRLVGTRKGSTPVSKNAIQGWARIGASTGPPSLPVGQAVSPAVLGRADSVDGTFWVTDLASADRDWNWQVARFRLTPVDVESMSDLRIEWTGHGEPTAGYGTKLGIWDPTTSGWEWLETRDALGADATLQATKGGAPSSFCLSCHDGTPPAGVTVPSSVTVVGSFWSATTGADFHGDRVGTGPSYGGGGLVPSMSRGMTAINCSVCHEVHGNANLYHVSRSVVDSSGVVVTSGNQMQNLCKSCHTGTVDNWHQGCLDCHNSGWGHGGSFMDSPETNTEFGYPNASSDCSLCHNHGSKSFVHSDDGRGVDERDQAQAAPGGCHPCHNYDTTF